MNTNVEVLQDLPIVSDIPTPDPRRFFMFKTVCHQRYLKVKIKSLAAESRIIRSEMRKCRPGSTIQGGLQSHRCWDVRQESRGSLLAYAYLRGRSFKSVERCSNRSDFRFDDAVTRMRRIVRSFGNYVAEEGIDSWLEKESVGA